MERGISPPVAVEEEQVELDLHLQPQLVELEFIIVYLEDQFSILKVGKEGLHQQDLLIVVLVEVVMDLLEDLVSS
jgi:hypothetical protein